MPPEGKGVLGAHTWTPPSSPADALPLCSPMTRCEASYESVDGPPAEQSTPLMSFYFCGTKCSICEDSELHALPAQMTHLRRLWRGEGTACCPFEGGVRGGGQTPRLLLKDRRRRAALSFGRAGQEQRAGGSKTGPRKR